ncbi:hypothetical protein BJX62DRAFT_35931 [Aspergillus germanicus]
MKSDVMDRLEWALISQLLLGPTWPARLGWARLDYARWEKKRRRRERRAKRGHAQSAAGPVDLLAPAWLIRPTRAEPARASQSHWPRMMPCAMSLPEQKIPALENHAALAALPNFLEARTQGTRTRQKQREKKKKRKKTLTDAMWPQNAARNRR